MEKYSEAFESPGPALAEARKKLSVRSGEALKEADATSSVGSSEADASPSAGMLTMVTRKGSKRVFEQCNKLLSSRSRVSGRGPSFAGRVGPWAVSDA